MVAWSRLELPKPQEGAEAMRPSTCGPKVLRRLRALHASLPVRDFFRLFSAPDGDILAVRGQTHVRCEIRGGCKTVVGRCRSV